MSTGQTPDEVWGRPIGVGEGAWSTVRPRPAKGPIGRYVALGDSFSAATGCSPNCAWPDLVAEHLGRSNPQFSYCNLAFEGARAEDVHERIPEALDRQPDLVSVVCGINDVLFSLRFDSVDYANHLTAMLNAFERAPSAVEVIMATVPETLRHLKLRPRLGERLTRGVCRLNRTTRNVARAYGVACVELADHPELADPANYAPDGLHPSDRGQELVGAEMIRTVERMRALRAAASNEAAAHHR